MSNATTGRLLPAGRLALGIGLWSPVLVIPLLIFWSIPADLSSLFTKYPGIMQLLALAYPPPLAYFFPDFGGSYSLTSYVVSSSIPLVWWSFLACDRKSEMVPLLAGSQLLCGYLACHLFGLVQRNFGTSGFTFATIGGVIGSVMVLGMSGPRASIESKVLLSVLGIGLIWYSVTSAGIGLSYVAWPVHLGALFSSLAAGALIAWRYGK